MEPRDARSRAKSHSCAKEPAHEWGTQGVGTNRSGREVGGERERHGNAGVHPGRERARRMGMLIIILVVLLIVFGGGGYYMGPGVGYYGGGIVDVLILLVILYLLFGRGRTRL